MTPNHPKEIANRFQVKSILGQGGMGVVYEAYDPSLAKTVAIKTLKEGLPAQSIVRFQQEAIAIGKLKHKNIIDVYDFGIDGNTPYLVMEFLKGQTLSEFINSPDWESEKLLNVLEIFVQICDGLAHAHNTNILHRDIKPSNIMLVDIEDKKSHVKLVDFGLAKLDDENQSITATGAALGSPLYMSPEQIAGKELDAQTDIYSLGCVMYETICGSPPFRGDTAAETMVMHRQSVVPEFTTNFHSDELPKQLLILIRSCLQKEKTDRPTKIGTIQRILADTILDITPHETIEPAKPRYEFFSLHSLPKISLTGKLIITGLTVAVVGGAIYLQQRTQNQVDMQNENYPVIKKAFTKIPLPEQNLPMAESLDTHLTPKFTFDPYTNTLVANKIVDDESLLVLKEREFQKLSLRSSIIRGKTTNALIDLPITSIDFGHTKIHNSSIKDLAKIKTLKCLDLERCKNLTNRGYSHLASFSALENPILRNDNVDDQTANIVSKINSLKILAILGPSKLTDTGFSYLKKLKKIEFLDVSGTKVTMKSLNKLNAFPRLTGLGINSLNLKDKDLSRLVTQNPKLKELRIAGNFALTKDGYKYIKSLKSLEHLNVSQSNFGDESLKDILSLNLKSLDVNSSKVTGKGIALIARAQSIEKLVIRRLNLSDKDVACLANMKNLKDLQIAYNKISDKSLVAFAKIKTLKSIILKGTSTADSDKKYNNAQITMEGLSRFVKELPTCRLID